MNTLKKMSAYITGGIGVLAISENDNFNLAFSGWAAFSIVSILVLGLIIIIYRVTSKVDLVELVRAWRSIDYITVHKKNPELSSKSEIDISKIDINSEDSS